MIYFMMINDHWTCFGEKKEDTFKRLSEQPAAFWELFAISRMGSSSCFGKPRVKCADTRKHAHTNTASLSTKNICFIVTRQWQLSSGDLTHNCELVALGAPQFVFPVSYSFSVLSPTTESHFPQVCFSHASFWMSCHLLLVFQCPKGTQVSDL